LGADEMQATQVDGLVSDDVAAGGRPGERGQGGLDVLVGRSGIAGRSDLPGRSVDGGRRWDHVLAIISKA
jgi:hypothetical protein